MAESAEPGLILSKLSKPGIMRALRWLDEAERELMIPRMTDDWEDLEYNTQCVIHPHLVSWLNGFPEDFKISPSFIKSIGDMELELREWVDDYDDESFFTQLWVDMPHPEPDEVDKFEHYMNHACKIQRRTVIFRDENGIKINPSRCETGVTFISNPGRVVVCCFPEDVEIDFLKDFDCEVWVEPRFENLLRKLATDDFVGVSAVFVLYVMEKDPDEDVEESEDKEESEEEGAEETDDIDDYKVKNLKKKSYEAKQEDTDEGDEDDNMEEIICTHMNLNEHLKYVTKIVLILDDEQKSKEAPVSYTPNFKGVHVIDVSHLLYYRLMHLLLIRPHWALQKSLDTSYLEYIDIRLTATNCGPDVYMYNINASLLICFHNYYFSQRGVRDREGDGADVENIVRVGERYRMPLYLINDATRIQMARIIATLKTADFSRLENLFVFVLSHGGEGDTIYTREGNYCLYDDVVRPLEANDSLDGVNVLIFVVICRGRRSHLTDGIIPAREGGEEARRPVLKKNINLFFSGQPGYKSFRHPKLGSFCIRAVAKVLSQREPHISMLDLASRINEEMFRLFREAGSLFAKERGPDTTLWAREGSVNLSRFVPASSMYPNFRALVPQIQASIEEIADEEIADELPDRHQ